MGRAIITIALAAILLAGMLYGCGDKGNEPDLAPVKENVYISATDWRDYDDENSRVDQIYVFDADSLHLLDSIPLASPALDIEVSSDGRWLYASRFEYGRSQGGTDKIDILTGEVVWSQPYRPGSLSILRNGELLLQGNVLVDPGTGDELGRIPDSLVVPDGFPTTRNREEVVVIVWGGTNRGLRLMNVVTGEVHSNWIPRLPDGSIPGALSVTLHPDGRHVLFVSTGSVFTGAWVVIGDMESGETIGSFWIGNPYGEIVVSPDRRLGVVTGPAQPTGLGGAILHLIDLTDWMKIPTVMRSVSGQVRFTADGSKIIATPPSSLWASGPLQIVDPATGIAEITVHMPFPEALTGGLAIGPRPVGYE